MAKYRLTNQAVVDLNKIWEYTFFEWSEQQADKYYNALLGICKDIANNPSLGRSYQGTRKGLLGIQANKHLIFYRIIAEGMVEIIRILHERMDIESKLKA